MYFVLRPKLKTTQEYDYKLEEQNKTLQYNKECYEKEIANLQEILISKREDVAAARAKEEQLLANIEKTRANMEEEINQLYQKSLEVMQEKLSNAAEKESKFFVDQSEKAKQEYLDLLAETVEQVQIVIAEREAEVKNIEQQLATLRAKADAAIAAAKREEEKLLEIDKYKILVSELDLLEINRLREIAPYFRNARAIYKIIWESYYRNNTTDLINRVIGAGTHTGIYKLTNLKNQKVYIGQAANLADRWKDHIKAGLGIDTPNNMLYAAMIKDGVENFTFEVLEECERSALNDRETYYIEFYRSQEHGYNMTKGGARN